MAHQPLLLLFYVHIINLLKHTVLYLILQAILDTKSWSSISISKPVSLVSQFGKSSTSFRHHIPLSKTIPCQLHANSPNSMSFIITHQGVPYQKFKLN